MTARCEGGNGPSQTWFLIDQGKEVECGETLGLWSSNTLLPIKAHLLYTMAGIRFESSSLRLSNLIGTLCLRQSTDDLLKLCVSTR